VQRVDREGRKPAEAPASSARIVARVIDSAETDRLQTPPAMNPGFSPMKGLVEPDGLEGDAAHRDLVLLNRKTRSQQQNHERHAQPKLRLRFWAS
jgi:hypothetical protein